MGKKADPMRTTAPRDAPAPSSPPGGRSSGDALRKPAAPSGPDTGNAFHAIFESMLRPIAAHTEPGRRLTLTRLHQTRIALRRLRTALPIFAEFVPASQTAHLKKELKWLSGQLGQVRDLQVMQQRLKRAHAAGKSALLLNRVAVRSAAARETARAAIAQPRFAALLADIRRWIASVERASQPTLAAGGQPARQFAKRHLMRIAERVIAEAARVDQLGNRKRHQQRIAAKKLYYAIGFFEHLFARRKAGKQLATFARELKKLLKTLGALNDISVQRELARQLLRAQPAATPQQQRTAKAVAGPDRTERDQLLKSAASCGRKLAKAQLFDD